MKTKTSLPAQLQHFRQQYILQPFESASGTWQYYDTHTGQDTLLLMPGNGGTAEALFFYISGFAPEFRVIVPDIPATVRTMEDAVAGFRALIAHLGIHRLHLMGLSFGGALAQIFMRRYPNLVDDVILTHTAIPAAHLAEVVRMQRAFIEAYPAPLLMFLITRRLHRELRKAAAPADSATRQFWQNYYAEHYLTQFGKQQLRSRARLSNDYYHLPPFQTHDLKTWKGEMLIIESEADELFDEGDRGALLAMYPRAYVQTLRGMSHLATILASGRIIESSLNFLLRDPAL